MYKFQFIHQSKIRPVTVAGVVSGAMACWDIHGLPTIKWLCSTWHMPSLKQCCHFTTIPTIQNTWPYCSCWLMMGLGRRRCLHFSRGQISQCYHLRGEWPSPLLCHSTRRIPSQDQSHRIPAMSKQYLLISSASLNSLSMSLLRKTFLSWGS